MQLVYSYSTTFMESWTTGESKRLLEKVFEDLKEGIMTSMARPSCAGDTRSCKHFTDLGQWQSWGEHVERSSKGVAFALALYLSEA